ncbi:MAG: hypothetical protein ACKVI4_18180, partial [Actinomycetales bacterium]
MVSESLRRNGVALCANCCAGATVEARRANNPDLDDEGAMILERRAIARTGQTPSFPLHMADRRRPATEGTGDSRTTVQPDHHDVVGHYITVGEDAGLPRVYEVVAVGVGDPARGHDSAQLYAWGAPRFLATHTGAVRDAMQHERTRFHAWRLDDARRLVAEELSKERTTRAMRSDQVDFDEEVIDAGSELGLGSRVSVLWPYEYVSVFVVPRAKPKEDLDGADTPSLKAWCKEAHVAVGGTDTLRRRRLKDPARYQLSAAPPTSVRKKTRGWFTAHVVNRLDGDEFTLLFDVSTLIKPTSGSRLDDRYQRTYLRATKLVSRDEWPPAGDLNWCRGTHRDVGRDEAKWPTD